MLEDKTKQEYDFADSEYVVVKLLDRLFPDGKKTEEIIESLLTLPWLSPEISTYKIVKAVFDYYGLRKKEAIGNIFDKKARQALNVAAYLLHYLKPCTMTHRTIAAVLGFKSHSMVTRSIRSINHQIATNDDTLDIILEIRKQLVDYIEML